ncbi:Hcp family type VI secretion system effector [Roseateles sp. PN1]|uniref:Hcp family type VI secretion system effector n=1 Tax=Roseateles sp. PN1 TaxID=3137372 RepID=UPI00313A4839
MNKSALGLLVICASTLATPSLAATKAFIQFDQIKGSSTDKDHTSWSDVVNWSWSLSADTSWTKGGGAAVGKPQPGPFFWTQANDGVFNSLFVNMATGKAVNKIKLDVSKNTGAANPEVFFTMEFTGAFFTKLDMKGSAEGNVDFAGQFVFKTIKIGYRPQDSSGRLGAAKFATWDIPAGVASGSGYEFSGDATALMGLAEAMPPAAVVPEPSSYLLMLGGLAGVLALARRRSLALRR